MFVRLRHACLIALLLLPVGCRQKRGPYMQPGPAPGGPAPAPVNEQLSVTGVGQALTRVTSDPIDEYKPVVSPDGSSLLLVATAWEVVNNQKTSNVVQQIIVGVNPAGGSSRTIYTSTKSLAASPAWLPDSKGFVFMSNAMGHWNLVRSLSKSPNAAVSIVVRGDTTQNLDKPVVSPDGKRVAFQMKVSGTPYVGTSGLDGSTFTQLTEGSWPSWSPDGKQLALMRDVSGRSQIFLVNSETGDNLVQVTNTDANSGQPCWSPDGRYITFVSNLGWKRFPSGSAERTWNVFAVKPDGTSLTQLTDGARDSGHPNWGKDGWIYFVSNESGQNDIWRLKPGGDLAPSAAPTAAAPNTPTASPGAAPATK